MRRQRIGPTLALALVLTVLAGCAKEPATPGTPTSSLGIPSATATLSGGPTSKHGPVKAVRHLLQERSAALRGGDRAGFLAPIDDAAEALATRQGRFYDNVRGADLASWSYLVDPKSARRDHAKGGDSWSYNVYATYSYDGLASQRAVSSERMEVVRRPEGWRITSVASSDKHLEPWDLGKTTSVHDDRIVVLGVGTSKAKLRAIQRQAADAVPEVDDVWDGNWARGAVIVVPGDTEGAAKLSRTSNVASLAAVATGASAVDASGELQHWDRVVVNPTAWQKMNDTGRSVVLAHELTHVATGSLGTVPIWVSEGFADYVGWKGTGVGMRDVAREVGADVRDGDVPSDLPTEAEFRSDDPDQAYEEAWLAAKYVAFRYGEDKLVALYRQMAFQSDDSKASQDKALQATLKVSRSEFRNGWRSYVKARLG